jgi:hypothetical protein
MGAPKMTVVKKFEFSEDPVVSDEVFESWSQIEGISARGILR